MSDPTTDLQAELVLRAWADMATRATIINEYVSLQRWLLGRTDDNATLHAEAVRFYDKLDADGEVYDYLIATCER